MSDDLGRPEAARKSSSAPASVVPARARRALPPDDRGKHFVETNDAGLQLHGARAPGARRRRAAATRLGHGYVGTEHVLLGTLAAGDDVVHAALRACGVEPQALVAAVEARVPPGGEPPISGGDLPYTSRAKRVLELAMDEAWALRDDAVDVEHLLLALAIEGRSLATQVLRDSGVEVERLREEVCRARGRPAPPNGVASRAALAVARRSTTGNR